MKLTKVADLDKYEDSGYGIEFDCTSRFFISQMVNSVRVLLFLLRTKVHQLMLIENRKIIMLIEKALHKKMKFSINDFFSKCDQIRSKLRIWSYLLKKSLMENFIFV